MFLLSRPYLSEGGADSLSHAHFLSQAYLQFGRLELPRPLEPHPLPGAVVVSGGGGGGERLQLLQEGDSVSRALGSTLSRLLVYCQIMVDSSHSKSHPSLCAGLPCHVCVCVCVCVCLSVCLCLCLCLCLQSVRPWSNVPTYIHSLPYYSKYIHVLLSTVYMYVCY